VTYGYARAGTNYMIRSVGSSHTYAENEAWLRVRRTAGGSTANLYSIGEYQTGSSYGNAGFDYDFPGSLVIVDHPPAGTVTYDLYGYVRSYCAGSDTVTTTIQIANRAISASIQMR
ncbi:MAG TPA: hypothetical protein VGN75_16125, partial [Kaistia sp.]|nr:hypothetical protein [Kaistia sp.]